MVERVAEYGRGCKMGGGGRRGLGVRRRGYTCKLEKWVGGGGSG